MLNSFYVYAWRRPDTNQIFYIGKGKGKRAHVPKYSNKLFMNIINKLASAGLEASVEFLRTGLTETEAFQFEAEEIVKHGRHDSGLGPLANFTNGGEGPSGYRHSESAKAKISSAQLGRKMSAECRARLIASKNKPEAKAAASAASTGKYHSQESLDKMSGSQRMKPPVVGYKGVHKHLARWRARIYIDGKAYNIGVFTTQEEAARAYDAAAIEVWGLGNCYINIPHLSTEPAPVARTSSEAHRMMGPKKGAYKGVFQTSRSSMWQSKIYTNGKSHYLGAFSSSEEAAHAYDAAAYAAWGEDCYLNFPRQKMAA